jgi:alpha-mannosidase
VLRVVETSGKPAEKVRLAFATPLLAAREVDGQEMPKGNASISQGDLVTSFTPFQLHTFAVKLAPPKVKMSAPQFKAVQLAYDTSVATETGKPSQGCFDCTLNDPTADGQGHALPAEMLPSTVDLNGIRFALAPGGKNNAVVAQGQSIVLPAGDFNRVYLLAAAMGDDQQATFKIDDKPVDLKIQEWTGFIGQWDNRGWSTRQEPVTHRPGSPAARAGTPPMMRTITEFNGQITPGFIKRADVGWFASHRHGTDGANEPYAYSYLFAYPIDLPSGAKTLTLPTNEKIRVLAVTVANEPGGVDPAQPLYDTLTTSAAQSGVH